MGIEQMQQALEASSINVQKHQEQLRLENISALKKFCADEQLAQFLTTYSFDDDITVGAFNYFQANLLKKNIEWEDDFKRALAVNLLPVGNGTSGDIVVLDLLDFEIGILFHDYFWENEEEDPRKFLIKMNCSIGQFYLNSVQENNYPVDAYEAAAYMGADFTGFAGEE